MKTRFWDTPLRGFGAVLLVAALLFGGLGITGAAARAAIPGDALYPVKNTIEQARLSLTPDAGDRAELRLDLAEQRLQEIEGLISQGRYDDVSPAVLAFETNLHGALLELETVWRLEPARATEISLDITSALSRFAESLGVIAANAPEGVQSDVARALDTTGIAGSLDLEPDDLLEGEYGEDDSLGEDDGRDAFVNEDPDCPSMDDDSAISNASDDCASDQDDSHTGDGEDDHSDGNDNGTDDGSSDDVDEPGDD